MILIVGGTPDFRNSPKTILELDPVPVCLCASCAEVDDAVRIASDPVSINLYERDSAGEQDFVLLKEVRALPYKTTCWGVPLFLRYSTMSASLMKKAHASDATIAEKSGQIAITYHNKRAAHADSWQATQIPKRFH